MFRGLSVRARKICGERSPMGLAGCERMECAEGRSPFAVRLRRMRVSLRYQSYPLPARKGARGMVVRLRRINTLLRAYLGKMGPPWRMRRTLVDSRIGL